MIEEVKKILDEILVKYPVSDYPYRKLINERYAKELCQLFEPHDEAMEAELKWREGEETPNNSQFPIEQTIANPATNALKPIIKPDEGRLLTDEKIKQIFLSHFTKQYGEEAAKQLLDQLPECTYAIAMTKAQDAKTASIKDKHWEDQLWKAVNSTIALKDAEIAELKEQVDYMHEAYEVMIEVLEDECQEAKNELTFKLCSAASDACQARVERIFKEMEKNTYTTIKTTDIKDSGGIRERRITEGDWQALKEGVKCHTDQ